MTGTNVPPPTFGPNGFQSPAPSAILAGVQADITAAFGQTLDFNLNTPQGQLSSSEAAVIANNYASFVYWTQQFDPAYATGRSLDALARIYFLTRNPAEPTALEVTCTGGGAGVSVNLPIGSLIQDTNGNIYASTAVGTLPAGGGSITVPFACQTAGPIPVPNANAVSIYKAIPGWDSVAVASGEVGTNTETDSAFRTRRLDAVAGNSFGAAGSIVGAVAQVPGVLDYFAFDNGTASPVTVSGVSVAAHSIYVCVAGGAETAVATAIWSKKGGGCDYTGNTSVVIYDTNPLYSAPIPYTVKYQIPTALQILIAINIVNGPLVPSNATTLVQTALLGAFAGLDGGSRARIGSVLYANRYIPPVAALGSWAQVSALTLGSLNTPAASFTASISGTVMTVSAVSSGTIATNQFILDNTGQVIPGTFIVSLGSGSGGTGTYNLNQPQTVGSEAMFGATANQSVVSVQANQSPQLVAPDIIVTVS